MTNNGISFYAHSGTPNPAKVAFLLEALKLDYKKIDMQFGDNPENGVKSARYLAVCPNGRLPAIVDHGNNDFVVWESGAILYYLCEKYDQGGVFFGKTVEEKSEVLIWLDFQISGLGPTMGQVNWFKLFHKGATGEDVSQVVIDRYVNESYRLFDVIEQRLVKNGKWIALDRVTIADISFYGWLRNASVGGLLFDNYPEIRDWMARMADLEFIKKVVGNLA